MKFYSFLLHFCVLVFSPLVTFALEKQDSSNSIQKKLSNKSYFVENLGQWGPEVKYSLSVVGLRANFEQSQVNLYIPESKDKYKKVILKFSGQEGSSLVAENIASAKFNFYNGNDPKKWVSAASAFNQLRYKNVIPGADIVFMQTDLGMRFDLDLNQGVDVSKLSFKFENSQQTSINKDGALEIKIGKQTLNISKPLSFLSATSEKKIIPSKFAKNLDGTFGFKLDNWNGEAVVIDPTVTLSVLIGGSSGEISNAVEIDNLGNTYITGYTISTNFPTTLNAFDSSFGPTIDFLISSFDPAGNLRFSTYFGRSNNTGYDEAYDLALSSDQSSLYVVGGCEGSASTPATNCPVVGGFDATYAAQGDAFALRLNTSTGSLINSTYLGGSLPDKATAVAVKNIAGVDHVFIAGWTSSTNFFTSSPVIPVGVRGYDTSHNGGKDGFVVKMDANLSLIEYSTYIGGSADDRAVAVAADLNGKIYVTGDTISSNFPTLQAIDNSANGGYDIFVSSFNSALVGAGVGSTSLVYSTYLGSSINDGAGDIAVTSEGVAYVAGSVGAGLPLPSFPVLYNDGYSGLFAGYIAAILPSNGNLKYATYVEGNVQNLVYLTGISFDEFGSPWVSGHNFGTNTSFAKRYDVNLREQYFSQAWPGLYGDQVNDIAYSSGKIVITGTTNSAGSFLPAPVVSHGSGGAGDAWVMVMDITDGAAYSVNESTPFTTGNITISAGTALIPAPGLAASTLLPINIQGPANVSVNLKASFSNLGVTQNPFSQALDPGYAADYATVTLDGNGQATVYVPYDFASVDLASPALCGLGIHLQAMNQSLTLISNLIYVSLGCSL